MKKIWSKKRFQKTGHSSRTFGRFTHVFRSCRKQSYDSETTEDEAAEPQIPMESKEGSRGFQDQAGHRAPAGDGDRMMDITPDASGHRGSRTDSWTGSQNTVVEKEALALGSRAPGQQDLSKPARSQSEDVLREAHPQVLPPPSPKIGQRPMTSPITTRSGSAPGTPLTPARKLSSQPTI
ncbi:hypothetical protein MATL_G00146300 [Megalops atlanticus]|uniref:Striated muscle preferentially expressed protein kinase n=1 Tax=Megalops atlanticus TaxID=7932 RepID=A0A9D3PTL9_MEGAT|nr:hypothetical protein MATL_G00146300 [Megalops atlanticus]